MGPSNEGVYANQALNSGIGLATYGFPTVDLVEKEKKQLGMKI